MQTIQAKRPCKHCGSLSRRARGGACFCRSKAVYADPQKREKINRASKVYYAARKAKWPPQEKRVPVCAYRHSQPILRMMHSVRKSAKRRGLGVDLCANDLLPLPKVCPILGIELDYTYGSKYGRAQRNSPSVDRIDSSKGYVKGNVQVISMRANTLKSDSTIPELLALAAYMERFA